MDAGQLHKLARALRDVALDATSDPSEGRPSAAEALVAMDVFEHAPTTVSEIVARTGVVQSQVSGIVAALHAGGVLEREPDPEDGRRTRLSVPASSRKAFGTDRGARGISESLRSHLLARGLPSGSRDIDEIVRLLDGLATRFGLSDDSRSVRP